MITEEASLIDVAFIVCTALDRSGIRAVLTGGSAATYWSPEVYQSRDADFVLNFGSEERSVVEVMQALGYRSNGGTWTHKRSTFTVDFPGGPLAIGHDLVKDFDRIERTGGSNLIRSQARRFRAGSSGSLHPLERSDCPPCRHRPRKGASPGDRFYRDTRLGRSREPRRPTAVHGVRTRCLRSRVRPRGGGRHVARESVANAAPYSRNR